MRRDAVIAGSYASLAFAAKPMVFPPPISSIDSIGSHSTDPGFARPEGGQTDAHP
jgi:hypothetical protein